MKLESATLRYVRGPRTVPRKLRALLAVDPSGVLDQRVQTDFSKGWEELASSDYLVAPSVPRLDAVVVVQEPGAALPTAIESKVCGASNILFFLAKQCGLDGKNAMQEIDCASLDAVSDAIVDAVAQCPPEQRATPMGRRGWLERHCARNLEALNLVARANDPSARFVVGHSLSVADVCCWACLKCVEGFDAGYVQLRFPHLYQFAASFEQRHSAKLSTVP